MYLLAMSIFSYSVSPKILLINVRAIPQEKLRERQKKSDLEGSFWRNQITLILIHLPERIMWMTMWYGFVFPKFTQNVINQSMLESNDKSGGIDQERPSQVLYRSSD